MANSPLPKYSPAYLAAHTKTDASVQRAATREVFASYWYAGELLNAPSVTEQLSGGRLAGKSVDLEISNADGAMSADRDAGTLAIGNVVNLSHYLPEDTTTTRGYLYGRVTAIDIPGEVAVITVTVEDPGSFSTLWPAKVYTTDDFNTLATGPDFGQNWISPSTDLGRVYPVGFGHCRRVRAVYVFADYTWDQYCYIFNRGQVEATDADKGTKINAYRNGRLIDPDEYTVVDGSQAWPFGGYAFITFGREQSDGSSYYEITVDYYGTLMGGATAERNPAKILAWILSDATVGLGEPVNAASFAAAATTLSTLGGGAKSIYIDGAIYEQLKIQDLLDHLAQDCARSFLHKNSSGEWCITTDTYQSTSQATFGRGDDQYRNIIDVNKYSTPDRTRNLTVKFAYNAWTDEFAHALERVVFDDGEDVTLELPLIQHAESADLIACYLQRREQYATYEIDLDLGMEARDLVLYQPVTVVQQWQAPDKTTVTNINGQFQVRAIERGLYQWNVIARTNSADIYTYSAGDLPTDQADDTLADYSFTPPSAPTGLAVSSSGSRQSATGGDGTTLSWYRLSAVAPTVNCQYLEFGYKEKSAANYQWTTGEEDAGTWYGLLDGLVPGQLYYFAARAVNNANASGCTQGVMATIKNTADAGYVAPGDSTKPGTITAGTATVKLKTWRFPWTKSTAADIKDYHVQISTGSGFASTVYDGYVGADYKEFTYDAASYGATLYARVKGRDHTGNESESWSSTMSATCSQIVGGDITDLTITGGKIADLAITNAKIANATITSAKIADLSADKITTGTITGQTITISTSAALNIDTGSGMVIKKAGDILFEADSSDRGEIIWQLGSSSLTAKLGASYDYKTLDFYPSAANTALLDLGGGAAWKRIWLNGYDVVLGRTNMIGSGGGNDVYLGDYVDSFYPIGSLALGTANDPWTDLYLAGSGSAYWRIFYYYNDVNTDGLWINYNGTGRFVFDGGGNLKLDGQLFQNYWCMDIVQGSEWDLFSGGLEAFRRHDGAYLHKTMRGEKIQTPVVSQKSGKDIVTIMDRKAENKSEYAMVLSDHIQVLYECVHSLKTDMEKLKNAA